MESRHVCSHCGNAFGLPLLPSAGDDLIAGPVKLIRLEEYLKVSCPACGHREDAQERRFFFDAIGPQTLRWIVVSFVLLMLCAAVYQLLV